MNIQTCFNPTRIYNQYLDTYMYVSCGHCEKCLNKRAHSWIERLDAEKHCWKYTIFFTLTYNEEYVPSLNYDESSGMWLSSNRELLVSLTEDDLLSLDSSSLFYMNRLDKLRILYPKDVQNFIKRLRRHIDYRFGSESRIPLRYYICGEYGPTTFRPHYHGQLFFNDDRVFREIEKLVTESWSVYDRATKSFSPIGLVDVQPDSASSTYVSAYLNSFSHLPQVLTFPKIRPFHICSKCPPIGSLFESNSEIQSIFHNGNIQRSVPHFGNGQFVSTPIPAYLRYRLFPKCLRYSLLSHTCRVALYGFSNRFAPKEESETFEVYGWRVLHECRRQYYSVCSCYSWFLEFICKISTNFKDVRPIIRCLALSRRVLAQCHIFGCSLDYYVSRIENFYQKFELGTLGSWYAFAEEYSKHHNYLDLLSYDIDFVDNLVSGNVSSKIIEYYGFNSSTSQLKFLDYRASHDYQSMVQKHINIFKQSTKTKAKNDYLLAHPEKRIFAYG